MSQHDPIQVLYHLSKTLEGQAASIDKIQEDVHSLRVDVEVIKRTGVIVEKRDPKDRIKDSAAGGGLGAIVVGLVMAVWEYFKAKSGG